MAAVLASALIALCIITSHASCSDPKRVSPNVLRFVTWNPGHPEVWKSIIAEFEKRNPGITVIREFGPSSSTSFHDMLAQKLRNRSPEVDVFFMDVIWVPEFAAAGWADPIDELLPPAEREQFLPGAIAANTCGGRLYGVPLFIDAGMLFYRSDLLRKYGYRPPATWQEMERQGLHIVREEARTGNDICVFSAQFKQYEGLVCVMQEFILGNNGRLFDPETRVPEIQMPAAIEAVRYVREHIIGRLAPRGVLTYQEPESLALFVQGRALFHRNWPYVWEIAGDPRRSRIAGRVGVTYLPRFPGGRSRSTLGGWQLGVSAFSRNRKMALGFIAFLTGAEIQKRFAIEAGRAPSRKELYRDREVLAANPQFKEMKTVFLNASPRPRTPLYPAVSDALQRYFSTALADPDASVEEEAGKAADRIRWIESMMRRSRAQ
ncbi:MAG: ABC transporter substrate-binding protein [Spirochaetes bacterium]|nr:ABC transporter substrate-binding protein [Spirochaetota bacterium]